MGTKISALAAITGANTAAGDLLVITDVSDTTQGAGGTTKRITRDEMKTALLVAPGPIGGTTPAAGSFTTLSASGTTATGYNLVLDTNSITTGRAVVRLQSTGALFVNGIEASAGGTTITGSAAYSAYSGSFVNTPYYLISNSAIIGTISSTGLAVTGAVSATGILSTSGTTDATSTTAAALKTAGGLAVAKKIISGESIAFAFGVANGAMVTLSTNQTKTCTITLTGAVSGVMIIAAMDGSGGINHARAMWLLGGRTADGSYGVTAIVGPTNTGNATISAMTSNNGNVTFTVATSGGSSGNVSVSVIGGNSNSAVPTIAFA